MVVDYELAPVSSGPATKAIFLVYHFQCSTVKTSELNIAPSCCQWPLEIELLPRISLETESDPAWEPLHWVCRSRMKVYRTWGKSGHALLISFLRNRTIV